VDTFVLARKKKNKRKVARRVIIREVNTRASSGNLSLQRVFNLLPLEKGK
jgi:hypothetical protein